MLILACLTGNKVPWDFRGVVSFNAGPNLDLHGQKKTLN